MGFHDLAIKSLDGSLFGLAVPLGPRSSVSAGSGSSGGWGYQVFASIGNPPHAFRQLQYKSPWGLLLAGADRIDRQTTALAEAHGAVSVIDGRVFAPGPIYDSFVLVHGNGLEDVHVLQENRSVDTSDSAGRLLPGLRAFDINRVAIDPTGVPLDRSIDVSRAEVRPQDRSGVVANFGVKVSHGAILHLVEATGAPVPVGSTARLLPKDELVPVCYDFPPYGPKLTLRGRRRAAGLAPWQRRVRLRARSLGGFRRDRGTEMPGESP
jgi:outer membrane usher protein